MIIITYFQLHFIRIIFTNSTKNPNICKGDDLHYLHHTSLEEESHHASQTHVHHQAVGVFSMETDIKDVTDNSDIVKMGSFHSLGVSLCIIYFPKARKQIEVEIQFRLSK